MSFIVETLRPYVPKAQIVRPWPLNAVAGIGGLQGAVLYAPLGWQGLGISSVSLKYQRSTWVVVKMKVPFGVP